MGDHDNPYDDWPIPDDPPEPEEWRPEDPPDYNPEPEEES